MEELDQELVVRATEKVNKDPIILLMIEDLHERLSLAHRETAALHEQRTVDVGIIATLTGRITDLEQRLDQCESQLTEEQTNNRVLKRRLEEIKTELESTRRKLQIALEKGWQAGAQEPS